MTVDQIEIGMEVGYICYPSLMSYRGKVVAVERTEHGGDCRVIWNNHREIGAVEECASNLRTI